MTIEEIATELNKGTDARYFPGSKNEVNQVFVTYKVTEPLEGGRFIAVRDGAAIICHGPGGHFILGPAHPQIDKMRYQTNDASARPLVEVQDVILSIQGTEGATTIWTTVASYEQVADETDQELE